jgi:cell division protein FtsQ
MNVKIQIKKIFILLCWCIAGVVGIAVLIAAINAKNSSLCQGMDVEINGGAKALLLTRKDVAFILENGGFQNQLGKKVSAFDLSKMEGLLKKNNWIKEAQLYFDNNGILKIRIQERTPVARIFSITGSSFLIDSNGVQMALPGKTIFKLPVFTNFPGDRFGLHKDSALTSQIKNIASYLNQDPFWSDQIQSVNIQPAKTFTLTPLIGSQSIEFGDGNDFENKFHRLFVFYEQVLSQTGFEKYTRINLAYTNQVIAIRKGGIISRTDSIQARKNVMEMIRLAQKMESDTGKIREAKPLEKNILTEQNLVGYDLPADEESPATTNKQQNKNKP